MVKRAIMWRRRRRGGIEFTLAENPLVLCGTGMLPTHTGSSKCMFCTGLLRVGRSRELKTWSLSRRMRMNRKDGARPRGKGTDILAEWSRRHKDKVWVRDGVTEGEPVLQGTISPTPVLRESLELGKVRIQRRNTDRFWEWDDGFWKV